MLYISLGQMGVVSEPEVWLLNTLRDENLGVDKWNKEPQSVMHSTLIFLKYVLNFPKH